MVRGAECWGATKDTKCNIDNTETIYVHCQHFETVIGDTSFTAMTDHIRAQPKQSHDALIASDREEIAKYVY